MKTLSLKLHESLHTRLTAAARRRGQTKSSLVREALEAFLDTAKPSATGSCLEWAAHLVGCVEGPGDLSFNKEHLRGYGK